jgi:lysozyme
VSVTIHHFFVFLIVLIRRLRRRWGLPIKGQNLKVVGPDAQELGHYYEGLSNEAYPDPATGDDPWTVGIGCTGTDGEGNKIGPGTYWDDDKCYSEYDRRMATEFDPCIQDSVVVDMVQKEYDAMIDLCYNIGTGNFESSTLLKKYNDGDKQGAADEFPKWNLANGQVMKGLERRRWAERHVFLGGNAADGIQDALAKYP